VPHGVSQTCVSAKASRGLSLITIVFETNIMTDCRHTTVPSSTTAQL
jgi:hypothetical protein